MRRLEVEQVKFIDAIDGEEISDGQDDLLMQALNNGSLVMISREDLIKIRKGEF